MSGTFSRLVAGKPYSSSLQSALRRLDALVDWERRTRVVGAQRRMRVDNKPARLLLDALGNPQCSFNAVHVTGSKGKGSVAALVGSGISAAGFKTGVYGSPHVERVNERVKIAGACIDDDALAVAVDDVLDVRERGDVLSATWFDVFSVAGMLALQKAGVDWAVVEVGLGGRLDSTNVLGAPVVVVTNIALEHQDIIGPTLRDIAYEKAGIISRDSHSIVGMHESDELASIFKAEAEAVGAHAPLFLPPAAGAPFASHNIALARCALDRALPCLDAKSLLSDERAVNVLSKLPGRMERFTVSAAKVRSACGGDKDYTTVPSEAVDVTVDGAHVAQSVGAALDDVGSRTSSAPVVLLALGRDKSAALIWKEIKSRNPLQVVVTAVSENDPYLPADELFELTTAVGERNVVKAASPAMGLMAAVDLAGAAGTHVVIIGSLHLAGAVRPMLVSASEMPDGEPDAHIPQP